MANRQPVNSDGRVVDLLERFLDYRHQNSAPATCQFSTIALNSFAPFIGNLRVSRLEPDHVYDWIDRKHRTVQRTGKSFRRGFHACCDQFSVGHAVEKSA